MSRESGRLAGVGEPDAVECRGLEESLRYSNMRMVTVRKRKGKNALKEHILLAIGCQRDSCFPALEFQGGCCYSLLP